MLIAQAEHFLLMAAGAVFLMIFLASLYVMTRVFTPWLQSLMAGVPLSVLSIIGMRLRRTDVKAVVRALVMAHQAGAPLSVVEVERAYLQRVDLEKVVLAFIRAKKDGRDFTFEQLVEADLDKRLEEKLRGR